MPKADIRPLPFHTDLNGYERVQRAFARKLWAHGFRVWQDAGKGAVPIAPPKSVPAADPARLFNAACLSAMGMPPGTGFPERIRRKCVYLIKYGRVAVHFEFADGSNPFVKYCDSAHEALYEIQAWAHEYDIAPAPSGTPGIANYRLSARRRAPRLFPPCVGP